MEMTLEELRAAVKAAEAPLIEELRAAVKAHSNDALAEKEGSVYQVWQDGEVTLTKCGSLLGQRTLHMIYPGFPGFEAPGVEWAHPGKNSFIYTNEEGAKAVHRLIARLAGKHPYCS